MCVCIIAIYFHILFHMKWHVSYLELCTLKYFSHLFSCCCYAFYFHIDTGTQLPFFFLFNIVNYKYTKKWSCYLFVHIQLSFWYYIPSSWRVSCGIFYNADLLLMNYQFLAEQNFIFPHTTKVLLLYMTFWTDSSLTPPNPASSIP